MLFPFMGNLGTILYVLIAIIGVFLTLKGYSALTLGTIAAFLQLSRSFSRPIAQISQQLNNIILALAGGKRIFELLDAQPEVDDGTVDLVRVTRKNGQLVETTDSMMNGHGRMAPSTFRYKEKLTFSTLISVTSKTKRFCMTLT